MQPNAWPGSSYSEPSSLTPHRTPNTLPPACVSSWGPDLCSCSRLMRQLVETLQNTTTPSKRVPTTGGMNPSSHHTHNNLRGAHVKKQPSLQLGRKATPAAATASGELAVQWPKKPTLPQGRPAALARLSCEERAGRRLYPWKAAPLAALARWSCEERAGRRLHPREGRASSSLGPVEL